MLVAHPYLRSIVEKPQSKRWSVLKLERKLYKPVPASRLAQEDRGASFSRLPVFAREDGPSEEEEGRRDRILSTASVRDATEFKARLKDALRPLFKTKIHCEAHDDALWAMVEILGVGYAKGKVPLVLVHFPHAEYVFASSLPHNRIQLQIWEALKFAFDCDSVRRVNANGTDLAALTDIALHPLSQGSFGAYRLYQTLLDESPITKASRPDAHLQGSGDGNEEEEEEAQALQGDRRRRRVRLETAREHADAARKLLGSVVDARAESSVVRKTTGALDTRQVETSLTQGTKALREIVVVVDQPILVGARKLPFACAVTLRGPALLADGFQALVRRGMARDPSVVVTDPSRSAFGVENEGYPISDASNVIRSVLQASSLAGAKRVKLEDGEEEEESGGVRTVSVATF